jgi:hypothetical protein
MECLACEKQFEGSGTYCSPECELIFIEALKESAESSKIKGLVDADGNSILGNAYQQALARTIKSAAATIGIKLPEKE